MKAKKYISIIAVLMFAGGMANAQVVVTRHNHVYGYEYSSRIMRFHKSYSTFSYYSPIYTETYWYNYSPYSWGVSIYGNDVVGVGLTGYPVFAVGYYGGNYGYSYGYNYGYYSPYYDPYYDPYYFRVYSPVVVRVKVKTKTYYTWNRHYYEQPVIVNKIYYTNAPSVRYVAKSPEPSTRHIGSVLSSASSQGRSSGTASTATTGVPRNTQAATVSGNRTSTTVQSAAGRTAASTAPSTNRNTQSTVTRSASGTTTSTAVSRSRQSTAIRSVDNPAQSTQESRSSQPFTIRSAATTTPTSNRSATQSASRSTSVNSGGTSAR
ncbi:MAG TPA: hypothetical protein GXZ49_00190, partial [Bacteroidetes bacterium]|nr:hypothetical protein [Bacteroidota bacterium]